MHGKRELRREIRQGRQARSSRELTRSAQALVEHWPKILAVAGRPELLLGFQPTRFEPDPRPLISLAMDGSLSVLLPRPLGGEKLEWVSAESQHLVKRLDTIPLPVGVAIGVGAEPLRNQNAIMLVPALAVDPETGIRLGHGGGYYDRLLAQAREQQHSFTTIAVVFEDELRQLPTEAHDQPVDAILTEAGLLHVPSR